jgi:hypothetical protein
MATRRAGLRHPDLAARPCPNLLDRVAGPRVRGLYRLEEVQNVLCARGRPQSQEPMVGVRERPPAADGDEAGVAVFGEDYGYTCPVASAQRSGSAALRSAAEQRRLQPGVSPHPPITKPSLGFACLVFVNTSVEM